MYLHLLLHFAVQADVLPMKEVLQGSSAGSTAQTHAYGASQASTSSSTEHVKQQLSHTPADIGCISGMETPNSVLSSKQDCRLGTGLQAAADTHQTAHPLQAEEQQPVSALLASPDSQGAAALKPGVNTASSPAHPAAVGDAVGKSCSTPSGDARSTASTLSCVPPGFCLPEDPFEQNTERAEAMEV